MYNGTDRSSFLLGYLSRSSKSNRLLLRLLFHLDSVDLSLFKLFLLLCLLHDSKLCISLGRQLSRVIHCQTRCSLPELYYPTSSSHASLSFYLY
jgi:hypothetical protein